ncbi:hypothetical protein Tco_1070116 [Tanacetum coccineum]|uniref:Uncharacterized protein n=1 Tax=Tanacetum coccineum TaxID=301880 RepID=A0ABQ5HLL1_9ASTR
MSDTVGKETSNLYGDLISNTTDDIIGDMVVTAGDTITTVEGKVIGNGMGVYLLLSRVLAKDKSYWILRILRSYRDDSYNYFFRQSGSVETQGECSSTAFGIKEGYIYGGPSLWEAMMTTNALNIEQIYHFQLFGRNRRRSESQQQRRTRRVVARRSATHGMPAGDLESDSVEVKVSPLVCIGRSRRIIVNGAHQNDIRKDYLSCIYDTFYRRDREGNHIGGRVILQRSFTGGPRYMNAHCLDALAICRVHGIPR